MICQRMGLPQISTMGFGRRDVSSERRLQSQPARITTCIVENYKPAITIYIRILLNNSKDFSYPYDMSHSVLQVIVNALIKNLVALIIIRNRVRKNVLLMQEVICISTLKILYLPSLFSYYNPPDTTGLPISTTFEAKERELILPCHSIVL